MAMTTRTEEWIEADCLPYYPLPPQAGLPVGYYPPQTEQGAQLPASTQAFQSDQWTAFSQQQQQQQQSLPKAFDAPQTQNQYHFQTLMSRSASSCGETAGGHGSPWSNTDHETEFDTYSYAGSPLSAGVPATYNQPPLSPVSWSSPMQMPFRPVDEQQRQQQQRMCSPVSNGSPHMAQGLYPHTSNPFCSPTQSPLMDAPPSAATSVPAQLTPPSMDGSSETGEVLDEDDAPGHEPYSKQIGRALMSLPGRSGNVQQIYDWFEANTTRHERQGWKNSVRHNLSLNEAFDRPPGSVPEGEDASEEGNGCKGKIPWTLVVPTLAEIQSTAKFRPKKKKGAAKPRGSPNRVAKPRAIPRGGGRTQSGRQGGRATSMMKQRRQSQPTALQSPAQGQWVVSMPEASSGPLTPESNAPSTPGESVLVAGQGMLDARFRPFDLSGYGLADVSGVWNGGGLFASGFGGLHEQPQWHPGNSKER